MLAEGVVIEIAPPAPVAVNLNAMTIDELKALADTLNVAYTWNIRPSTLRERIRAAQGGEHD